MSHSKDFGDSSSTLNSDDYSHSNRLSKISTSTAAHRVFSQVGNLPVSYFLQGSTHRALILYLSNHWPPEPSQSYSPIPSIIATYHHSDRKILLTMDPQRLDLMYHFLDRADRLPPARPPLVRPRPGRIPIIPRFDNRFPNRLRHRLFLGRYLNSLTSSNMVPAYIFVTLFLLNRSNQLIFLFLRMILNPRSLSVS